MSIDLSLDRLKHFIPLLPVAYRRPTVHIAGTNGKGSISAIVTSVLSSSTPPLRIGRYNSPHLIKITDCITINNMPIDDETYQRTRSDVEALTQESGIELSLFEVLTVTALQIFENLKVDVAVIEVGMGGRLDATNIISDEAILVSALSTIDLDHQNFLGPTVEDIAREKAAISRPGKPFVFGHQRYTQVAPVVKETVEAAGAVLKAPIGVVKRDDPVGQTLALRHNDVRLPPFQLVQFVLPSFGSETIETSFALSGDHQLDNLSTALGIIDSLNQSLAKKITIDAVKQGLANVQWRGRLSWHNVPKLQHPILVDGAHNPGSSDALSKHIRWVIASLSSPDRVHLHYILGMSFSPSKSPVETLSPLFDSLPSRVSKISVSCVGFTLPEGMLWVKPVHPADLEVAVKELSRNAETWVSPQTGDASVHLPNALERVRRSIAECEEAHHLVLLAGSLYLVADFYRLENTGRV